MKPKTIIILSVALLSVSTASIIARLLTTVPAVSMACWRMAVASSLLWVYSYRSRGGLSTGNLRSTILAGVFLGLHFAFFFAAVKTTSIAQATLLATLAPAFTLIFERLILKRHYPLAALGGLALALTGALMISGLNLRSGAPSNLGNMLALISSFWFALTFLITERVRRTTDTITYSRTLYLSAAVTLLGLTLVRGDILLSFQPINFLGLFLLGVIPTIFGHSLFYYAVKFIRPTVVLTVPLGEPVVASLMAWVMFGEVTSGWVIGGGGLILSGIFLVVRYTQAGSHQDDKKAESGQ